MLEQASLATERAREFVNSTGDVINRARSLVSGDSLFFTDVPKIDDLRRGLDAESLYEKRAAMKKIIAQMCKGVDMHSLFPDVVKNIHVASTELRKLIYLFVVHYSGSCPNEALLSVSAFQKDLVDRSMHVRSLALRMLSSMQIPAIHPVVMAAVKKCADDSAPIVRKTAAIALLQVYSVAGKNADMQSIYDNLTILLKDRNPDVASTAVMSFQHICATKFELLHPVFRHLCTILPDCEDCGQDVVLRVLLRYARTQFCDPTKPVNDTGKSGKSGRGGSTASSSSGKSGSSSSSDTSSSDDDFDALLQRNATNDEAALDPDHEFLLNAARPLLYSLSSTVVVSVCALYVHCAPSRYLDYCVRPLMRVFRSNVEGQSILLNTIYLLLERRPKAFAPYVREFYLLPQDSADVRALKHRMLACLAEKETLPDLVQEYKSYFRDANQETVAEAVKGFGLIVSRLPSSSAQTMRLLLPLFTRGSPVVMSEAVAVLRLLVVQGAETTQVVEVVFRLMQGAMQQDITAPAAVSATLWLVGEGLRHHPVLAAAAPDCFRTFVQRFASLDPAVKREVLVLGSKIWFQLGGEGESVERFYAIYRFALELARYDDNYLVRDQRRALECACDRASPSFSALKTCLEGQKLVPQVVDPFKQRLKFELGSFSSFFGVSTLTYEELPVWRIDAPDVTLRRPPRSDSSAAFQDVEMPKSRRSKAMWSSSSSSSAASSGAPGRRGAEDDGFYSEASGSEDDARGARRRETESSESSDGSSANSSDPGSGSDDDSESISSSTAGREEKASRQLSPSAPAKPVAVKVIIKR